MKDTQAFVVRSGTGSVRWENGQEQTSPLHWQDRAMQQFTDSIEMSNRSVKQHSGWQSVVYKKKRYQLFGGIRTFWFICLDHPIRGNRP